MTFIRLLRLTDQGIKAMRNQQSTVAEVQELIESNGGTLVGSWFTQGDYDISARIAVKGLYTGKTLPAMAMGDFVARFADSPELSMFLENWFRAGRKDSRRG